MPSVPQFSLRNLLLALCLLAGGAAHAQWVVYEAVFLTDETTSVNFAPYTGAYVIAPLDGGPASFVFTTEADGRVYTIAENTGRYFIAANKEQRRAVISAVSQNGTARAMYQASGLLNSTMSYNVGTEKKGARVPSELSGTVLASDDESLAPGPSADGSIGMAGSAVMTAVLRVDLSRILNSKENSMTDAVEMVAKLLQQYGYLPDGTQPQPAAPAQPAPQPAPEAPLQEVSTEALQRLLQSAAK